MPKETEAAELLRETANEIGSHYPLDMWPEVTSEQLKQLHEFARSIGLPDGSRFHVGGIRHALHLMRRKADDLEEEAGGFGGVPEPTAPTAEFATIGPNINRSLTRPPRGHWFLDGHPADGHNPASPGCALRNPAAPRLTGAWCEVCEPEVAARVVTTHPDGVQTAHGAYTIPPAQVAREEIAAEARRAEVGHPKGDTND